MDVRVVSGAGIIPVLTIGVGVEEDGVQEREAVAVVYSFEVGFCGALGADADGGPGCEGWGYERWVRGAFVKRLWSYCSR